MFFGDMLLSGPETLGRTGAIPTIGAVTNFFPEGSGWTITGLVQKIAIVADNCVVAWAGSQIGAQVAITKLREIAQAQVITSEVVKCFLSDLPQELLSLDLSLIGCLRTDQGFEHFVYGSVIETKMLDGTLVQLAGSGAETVAHVVATAQRGRLRTNDTLPHSAQKAYELGLQLGGLHLRREELHGDTLLQYFGGGYEVAVYNGERFTKDRGVTYVLWSGRELDAQGRPRPDHILTTTYVNDVLLVFSQKLIFGEGAGFNIGEIQLHQINPAHGRVKLPFQPGLELINPKTPWLCHCFLVNVKGTALQVAIVDRPSYDGTDSIELERNNGLVVKVHWRKEFWENLQFSFDRALKTDQ